MVSAVGCWLCIRHLFCLRFREKRVNTVSSVLLAIREYGIIRPRFDCSFLQAAMDRVYRGQSSSFYFWIKVNLLCIRYWADMPFIPRKINGKEWTIQHVKSVKLERSVLCGKTFSTFPHHLFIYLGLANSMFYLASNVFDRWTIENETMERGYILYMAPTNKSLKFLYMCRKSSQQQQPPQQSTLTTIAQKRKQTRRRIMTNAKKREYFSALFGKRALTKTYGVRKNQFRFFFAPSSVWLSACSNRW